MSLALALLVLLVLISVAAVSLYLARRTLGRDAVVGWLRERGVEAVIDVERLEPDGFTGKIRIGPAADPEIVVDRAEVRYSLQGFWNGKPLGVEVAEVRLVRPVAKASWIKGKFSVGSLDKVLDELRRGPPRPDARLPKVTVEGGRVILATDYGRADVTADGLFDNGKLMRLTARLQPTTVRVDAVRADVNSLRLTLATEGARVKLGVEGDIDTVSMNEAAAEVARFKLDGELPYPDLKAQRGDGRVLLNLKATADRVKAAEAEAKAVELGAEYDGEARGWVDSLSVAGALKTSVTTGALRYQDYRITSARVGADGRAGFDAKAGPRMLLSADARAQGAWLGMGPVTKLDDATILAAKRMLGRFDFTAPGVQLTVDKTVTARLTQPARLSGAGGLVVVTPQNGAPVFAENGGALHLKVSGGGLPTAEASVPRYSLTPGGLTATVAGLTAKGSLATLVDADIKTAGRFSLNNGAIAFSASTCSPVTLGRLEMGENDVDTISGALCPTKDPLLTLDNGAWRVRARAENIAANAPFLEAKVSEGTGTFDMSGKALDLKADATIASAKVTDVAALTRFNPILLGGVATSRGGDWIGDFSATDPQGRRLGTAHLVQTLATQSGTMSFDTGDLVFAQGGLQPAALSPMAALVASPASGRARFVGQVGWREGSDEVLGGGTLDLTDVGFRSPAGALSGLNGRIVFTSLVPALVTAPNQHLTVAKVMAVAPLTDIAADVTLDATSLKLSGTELTLAQGRLRLDPVTVPLDGKVWEGVLRIDGMQLADIVEASPFADRVEIDAKVSGVVPFTITPEGLRIADGNLAADRPGRISIHREALTGVAASGGAAAVTEGPAALVSEAPPVATPEPPPNTVADFAYQAMENLAFSNLDVTLNSLPKGRLGGLFHIKGRHDPPKKQVIRLSIIDLITQRFLQKELPLPSGTEVNLTLDSSLNLDDVLRDVVSAAQVGSADVQP